jgi:HEAT repeat protein
MRKIFIVIFFIVIVQSAFCEQVYDKRHILYLMHAKETKKAFQSYENMTKANNKHDFEILQKMSLILLENGMRNQREDIQRLTMFGAGIAQTSSSVDILENGLNSQSLQTQMIALHFISSISDDYSNELLLRAMNSNFLVTRFEAAYALAMQKHPHSCGQIEALMYKLPPFFRPFFPVFFAIIGTPQATSLLKDLLNDTNVSVRVEAIINAAKNQRDELLDLIRKRLKYSNIAEKEACIFAVGILKDSSSLDELKKISKNPTENVKISALKALFLLGDNSAKNELENLAKQNNLFAIMALGEISGTEEVLFQLTKSTNIQVKINAVIALLQRQDARSAPLLKEIFVRDIRDIALQVNFSIGRSLICFNVVKSAHLLAKKNKANLDAFSNIKQFILKQTLELKEEDFLSFANMIFDYEVNDMIPSLLKLLENLNTPEAIELIKKNSQKTGAPLIRDYCSLSLYRKTNEQKYEKYIIDWINRHDKTQLIKLKEVVPKKDLMPSGSFELTSEEKSQLLIEMYIALASKQDERRIAYLVNAIKEAHPVNRYALVGILIKATE